MNNRICKFEMWEYIQSFSTIFSLFVNIYSKSTSTAAAAAAEDATDAVSAISIAALLINMDFG